MSRLGHDRIETSWRHACLLYESREEHLQALGTFHREALSRGNRSVHVLADSPADEFRDALRRAGIEVERELERGAVVVLMASDVYLSDGEFEPGEVIDFWSAAVDDAVEAGFRGLSVSGDMSWAMGRGPDLERLAEYEAEVNGAIRESRMEALCCYDRHQFPAEGLAHAFHTHPRVFVGDGVLETDSLLERDGNGAATARWLALLLEQLRRSEASLRDAHTRQEKVLEVTPAAIYTCDAEGRITSFNPAAVELWGRAPSIGDSEERFCGSHRLYLPDGTPLEHRDTPMAKAVEEGESVAGAEVLIERPDGSRVAGVANVAPIRDDAGRIVGAANCLVDITEHKRIRDRLRTADRRKDEFLAMLSHELRNPLAPIRASLDLLRSGNADADGRRVAMQVLERQVGTLTRMVNDLLDVSRVTTGRIQIRRSEVDLTTLVEAVVEGFRTLFQEGDQVLTVELSEEPLRVMGDAARLEQVVVNLLSNATKYTQDGGRVWVTVAREGGQAVLRVRDDGMGIEPELRQDLFRLFTQGEQPLNRDRGGLGVGLALTRALVQHHRGSISVESDGRGTGSEFIVRLPLMGSPAEEPDRSPPDIDDTDAGGQEGAPPALRVLVAEDLPDAREIAEILLRTFGHEVRTAADGVEALEAAREFRPHVVLLDIGLPEMDGYTVARRIRQEFGGPGDPVLVALTGYGTESDREQSEDAGFDYHLVKPVDFATTVRELLRSIAEERAG